jgi:DNA-directed RNA polymerase specialized sigma24 family protein
MSTRAEMTWLLAAVAKGDRAAFERLYGETGAKLYGIVLRILGKPELADKVMREVYLKVWHSAENLDPAVATPMTWMVAIARKRAIDLVRKDGGAVVETMADATPGDGASAVVTGRDDRQIARTAVLPPQARPGKAAHRGARLLQRLEPRAIGSEARNPGEHNEDLAAPLAARNPQVHGVSVGRSVPGVSAAACGGA